MRLTSASQTLNPQNRLGSQGHAWLPHVGRYALTFLLAVTIALAASPWRTAKSATTYRLYLPLTLNPGSSAGSGPAMPGMGVAGSSYPDLLQADWHYAYEWCGFHTPGCTPMVKWWEMPESCPPVLLVGNEPNGTPPPDGAATSPAVAAQKSQAIRAMCSRQQTFLIVGNTAQADIHWTRAYLDAGGVYDALGTHCYSGTADVCLTMLADFQNAFPSAPMCVTEWNLLTKQMNTTEFERLMRGIMDLTPCSAVFSDINQGLYWSWDPIYWLVDQGGVLNARGQVYAER
jgi:hypothetical protein